MISIADFLLAVLWVGGSLVWLRGTFAHRGWCFAASLPTVVGYKGMYAYMFTVHTILDP